MTSETLRKKFLAFFKANKHKIAEPDSLVPRDDPTVLFTPAGMNQFKKEFLGFDSGFKRAATCQRCLRTDDLDKVGKTSGHHTFFEMLGNFSFGDYFKKEAIAYAWEFLTEELKILKEKLYVSVYKDDSEAYRIWKDDIKIPEKRIVKFGDKENFWPAQAKTKGPNGPCGPCSEIFYDMGSSVGCKTEHCDPSCPCGRFVEVWNLVFTQYNRKEGGRLEPLPNKNIDTGMGLERLAAVMQGARNNFETDLFTPIIKEIAAGSRKQAAGQKELVYAVADHLRAVVFAIYDGILPSNEARGYVARKLIRKSALHLRAMGFTQPYLYKLVPVLAEIMRSFYPDLKERQENISQIILSEENNFLATLNSSESLFKEKFSGLSEKQNPDQAGVLAFELYDTYGIPLELTESWLKDKGIKIDKGSFDKELSAQKERSKSRSAMKGDVFSAAGLNLKTKATKFSGYKDFESKSRILKIYKGNEETKKIGKAEEAQIVLDKTAFYPESGGQAGDSGELIAGRNKFEVRDTKKIGSVITHIGIVKEGSFKQGAALSAKVDVPRRMSIARNHTATHLLQGALRKVLGAHVRQQGSLVTEEKLRFDFTHFKGVEQEQLDRIEEIVNEYILENIPLGKKEMTLKEARKTGALAFFGEKYEEKVRVITIADFSRELCGGTHLSSTGEIGLFKITQEGSIASGVRRIEAVTGGQALKKIKEEESLVRDISSLLNVPPQDISQELQKRLSALKAAEKQLNSKKSDIIQDSIPELLKKSEAVNDIQVIASVCSFQDMASLRKAVDLIKAQTKNTIIALGALDQGKALFVVGVTADLVEKGYDASHFARCLANIIGGSGGGRKDFAQAGGGNPENLPKVFEELKNIVKNPK